MLVCSLMPLLMKSLDCLYKSNDASLQSKYDFSLITAPSSTISKSHIYNMHLLPSLVLAFGISSSVYAALSGYAPVPATCPVTPLVRTATGISASESSYISSRAPIASAALGAWLQKVNSAFSTWNLPAVALTTSGGGLRSLLTGAGVIQALDSRDSNVGTSGL